MMSVLGAFRKKIDTQKHTHTHTHTHMHRGNIQQLTVGVLHAYRVRWQPEARAPKQASIRPMGHAFGI